MLVAGVLISWWLDWCWVVCGQPRSYCGVAPKPSAAQHLIVLHVTRVLDAVTIGSFIALSVTQLLPVLHVLGWAGCS